MICGSPSSFDKVKSGHVLSVDDKLHYLVLTTAFVLVCDWDNLLILTTAAEESCEWNIWELRAGEDNSYVRICIKCGSARVLKQPIGFSHSSFNSDLKQ